MISEQKTNLFILLLREKQTGFFLNNLLIQSRIKAILQTSHNIIEDLNDYEQDTEKRAGQIQKVREKATDLIHPLKEEIQRNTEHIKRIAEELKPYNTELNHIITFKYSQNHTEHLRNFCIYREEKRHKLFIQTKQDLNNYYEIDKRQKLTKSEDKFFLYKLMKIGTISKPEYRQATRYNNPSERVFAHLQFFHRNNAKTGHKKNLLGTEKRNLSKYIYVAEYRRLIKFRLSTIQKLEDLKEEIRNTQTIEKRREINREQSKTQNAIKTEIKAKIQAEKQISIITQAEREKAQERQINTEKQDTHITFTIIQDRNIKE